MLWRRLTQMSRRLNACACWLTMKKADWQINQYDVLPDRVGFYLWPRAGGPQFEFKFRQPFAMEAKNASSLLSDYANPEARRVIAPARVRIR
jgi:hypothetical protein